jgi:succinate dehydrogenase/fumarate reductase cytochrome b subunit (b558 family)
VSAASPSSTPSPSTRPAAAARASTEPERRWAFWLRMIHSLSGLMPVGVFMLVQLWMHAKALAGPHAYHDTLLRLSRLPGMVVWQALILAALAYHALYGVLLTLRPKYNLGRYPHGGNWVYTLQRVTGLLAFAFLGLHGVLFWIPAQFGWLGLVDVYPTLVARMSATWTGVPWLSLAYLAGIAACAFHFAAGLWTGAIRWGLTASRRARVWSGAVLALLGLAVFGLGANTVLYLATGWGPVGPNPAADDSTTCDPAPAEESASPR